MVMNYVKSYRTKKGLTQLELAKKIDVTSRTIQAIENFESLPNIEICLKIANALDIPINLLFRIE